MIYRITWIDGRIDWCTAKDVLHLLQSYDKEFDLPLQEIDELEEISEEEAKKINITNTEYDEDDPDDNSSIPLYDLAVSDEFSMIATNEY